MAPCSGCCLWKRGVLFDNAPRDPAASFRPSSLSTVRVEHDLAGMLAERYINKIIDICVTVPEHVNDNHCVRETHAVLREAHQDIFYEQVFELVNCSAFNPSIDNQTVSSTAANNLESESVPMQSFEEGKHNAKKSAFLNQTSFQIYLLQLYEHLFVKAKSGYASTGRSQVPGQLVKDSSNLLGHSACLLLTESSQSELLNWKVWYESTLLSLASDGKTKCRRQLSFSYPYFVDTNFISHVVIDTLKVHGFPYVHLMSHPT
ncbi:hypothetical protein ACH5RR_005878 [Cinchona calisaya]|uniref:Uncharacterized protein n=1 Tax=Cinchona calisaya TaxID=153742 RepID=A0ABD3AMH1_9GENT